MEDYTRALNEDLGVGGDTRPVRLILVAAGDSSCPGDRASLLKKIEAAGEDAHSRPAVLQAAEGETIHVPHLGAEKVSRADYSLLERRGGTFTRDCFDALSVRGGFLALKGLEPGDYSLKIKREGLEIPVRVTAGEMIGRILASDVYLDDAPVPVDRAADTAVVMLQAPAGRPSARASSTDNPRRRPPRTSSGCSTCWRTAGRATGCSTRAGALRSRALGSSRTWRRAGAGSASWWPRSWICAYPNS